MYLSKCKNRPSTKVLFISKFELVFLVNVCSTVNRSSIVKSVSYEELIKSGKKLEKVGTIGKKSFI